MSVMDSSVARVLNKESRWAIMQGDALRCLRGLPDGCVQACCTSPPYWGLRSYLPADHENKPLELGLERTPEQYVARMVEVFREVRRVLRKDGTLWLNLGDSYAGSWGAQSRPETTDENEMRSTLGGASMLSARQMVAARRETGTGSQKRTPGLKPKDLVGIPWRVAFALQADGWVLRSEIIWVKANPMPESVTDRPTKAHEQVFLLSKAHWSGPQVAALSREDARWMALLVDTEGNIVVKHVTRPDGREWFGAQVAVANTSRALIERAADLAGVGAVLTREGLNAPVHYWQTSNRQAAAILRALYPYLIVKRRQAAIAIFTQEQLRHRGGRGPDRLRSDAETELLRRLWQDCKACNRFGTPDLDYLPVPDVGRWRPERYFYDAEAIAEEGTNRISGNAQHKYVGTGDPKQRTKEGLLACHAQPWPTRNARSVWTIATQPFLEAHFATMPPVLAERCILAGCPEGGTVLDPFSGAGTTGVAALSNRRRFLGIELNPAYVVMAERRIAEATRQGSLLEATP